MRRTNYTAMAFLAMAIAVVGLTGLFATFAAPLALERALAREVALDDALAAAHQPNAAAMLAALRPRLDDSAKPVLDATGDSTIDARIAAERIAMRTRFRADADATTERLRWLISMMTITGAAFGAVVLKISGNIRS